MNKKILSECLFSIAAIACLLPLFSAAYALLGGIFLAVAFGNPFLKQTRVWTRHLLAISVMGLGAGMNLMVVAHVGLQGIGYTVVGISTTLFFGTLLGKLLKTEKHSSLLITIGTAICGGSAIAAVAPVLRAKHHEVSIALGTVFILNAAALFLFPPIGHYFQLSEGQFGLWSALAIHDTSSVVGATMQYGAHAVEVGTTVKLARALWIVPVTLCVSFFVDRKNNNKEVKPQRPWFILGFLIMAALVTWIPALQQPGHIVEAAAKRLLVLTLFFIGSNLNRETLKSVGIRPFLQGFFLWILVASATLLAILSNWITLA